MTKVYRAFLSSSSLRLITELRLHCAVLPSELHVDLYIGRYLVRGLARLPGLVSIAERVADGVAMREAERMEQGKKVVRTECLFNKTDICLLFWCPTDLESRLQWILSFLCDKRTTGEVFQEPIQVDTKDVRGKPG